MQYFDESDDIFTRTGKVIGDIISALMILSVLAILVAQWW
jgi:hypothetical protein